MSNVVPVTRAPVPWLIGGAVGITGYKLVFNGTFDNYFDSNATINYNWSFSMDKWIGTQWIASGISNSSAPVLGYQIPAMATADLPYHVYLLPVSGSNAVTRGDWLRINCNFHWTYNGTDDSTYCAADLNVHPGDISGNASIIFPYLGADNVVNSLDVSPIAANWLATVPPGANPTSLLARADINGDGVVNSKDIALICAHWLLTWTNTPQP